jgi:flagellar biosynthesis/type III secretory pathway M-ring protein FliF/YscJ
VVVTEMPFSKVDAEPEPLMSNTWQDKITVFSPLIKYATGFVAVIVILMFFVRPLVKGVMARDVSRSLEAGQLLTPATMIEGGINVYSSPEVQGEKMLTDRDIAKQLAGADSKKFADILRTWLK